MKILITGASGFVGSYLCEEALRQGHEVWAGMRTSSSRKWLKYDGLRFITLDLGDRTQLKEQLSEAYDVVIHAAGVTKCLHTEDFYRNNYDCTRNLAKVMGENGILPRQFIYVSSLSAEGTSDYGMSKLQAENFLKEFFSTNGSGTDRTRLTIFRPTGVYGPREKDYFMMVKSIKQHVDFAVGYEPQQLTFIYVMDLVRAILTAVGRNDCRHTYNVTDSRVYSSRAFSDLIQKELGVKGVVHITAPLWFLKVVSTMSEWISHITGKPSTLNKDKYKIMAQRDWTCDISMLTDQLGYHPQVLLDEGVKLSIEWYRKQGWI